MIDKEEVRGTAYYIVRAVYAEKQISPHFRGELVSMSTMVNYPRHARIRARKRALGMVDTPESIEAMRNKGGQRTPEKRELPRQMEERAKAAGVAPLKACYRNKARRSPAAIMSASGPQ